MIATVDGLKNLKWLDTLTLEIGLPLSICYLYQDNLSAYKIITKTTKTKQVKYLLSKINLAQQYCADKLYAILYNHLQIILLCFHGQSFWSLSIAYVGRIKKVC